MFNKKKVSHSFSSQRGKVAYCGLMCCTTLGQYCTTCGSFSRPELTKGHFLLKRMLKMLRQKCCVSTFYNKEWRVFSLSTFSQILHFLQSRIYQGGEHFKHSHKCVSWIQGKDKLLPLYPADVGIQFAEVRELNKSLNPFSQSLHCLIQPPALLVCVSWL